MAQDLHLDVRKNSIIPPEEGLTTRLKASEGKQIVDSAGSGEAFEDFSIKDLQEWLQPHLQKEKIPDFVLKQLADQEIDGKVFMNMTDEDIKEVFTDLNVGLIEKLAMLRDEVAKPCLSVESRPVLPQQQQKEHVRQFAKNPKVMEKYHQSKILNVHETGVDSSLLSPVRQFFPCCDDGERADIYAFIAEKVTVFAAACMNDRRNGTIYFGVGNKDCKQYHYGEVLGLPLDKKQCEDEIMHSIQNSFIPGTVEAAVKCIHAVFVEVVLPDREEIHSHFVCEVDIQPKSDFVGDLPFFLNLGDSASSEKKQLLYRLSNGIPTEQKPDQIIKFVEEKNKLSEERCHKEVMMAESEQLASEWIDGLQQRNVEVDLNRRLHNFSSAEINKATHQLMRSTEVSESACFVKSSAGQEEVSKKQLQRLSDLEIISTKTCSECPEDLSELSKNHEQNFYRCNQATWWNFYFPGHVCPRDKLDDLKTKTCAVLEDVEEDEKVGFVAVYHQPGSGGTTLAMNIIWDLRSEFKSCRLKCITTDSARQIVRLYELGQSSCQIRRKPVLVMIDNEDDDRLNHLKRSIEEECQNKEIYGLACVFLTCVRCMTLPAKHQAQNVLLQQKLSTREKQFFMDRYSELKKKRHVNMDHLLSLNVMKEDFNEDYIKTIVAEFVQHFSEHEQKVLQHIALLNCYDLLFRPIPVACFDQLVMFQEQKTKTWESNFTPDPLMLFTTNERLSGRNKCLRVTNRLLCEFILRHLAQERSHEDLMEEFLYSLVFQRQSHGFVTEDLLKIVKDCMKKRGTDPSGKKRSKFSPFIQKLMNGGKAEEAIRCIDIVFERTGDAFIAQQIARIYIFLHKWDEAEKWAKRATETLPNNSFLLDTRGQIFRSRLEELLAECDQNHGKIDSSVFVKAVKYSHTGYKIFQRVQTLNDKERNDPPNVSGLFGQMEIALILCNILEFHPAFSCRADLQKFLSGSDKRVIFSATELDSEDVKWLMSLEENAFSCLKEVENQKMVCSSGGFGFTDTRIKFFLGEENIHRFEEKLNDQFGAEDSAASDPQRLTTESRRRVVTGLGGNSLYNIMTQCGQGEEGKKKAEKIWHLTSLNLKGRGVKDQRSKFKDLNMALSSALTLVCCHNNDFTEEEYSTILEWSMELFQMTDKPDPNKFINFDPYIFLFVFHWPTPSRQHLKGHCKTEDLKKAMGMAKEAFRIMCKDMDKKNNPIYFLTKDRGSVISKIKLQAECSLLKEIMVCKILKHQKAVQIVERFIGILVKKGSEVKMQLKTSQGNESEIVIPLFAREGAQFLWNKKVSFALGVGLGGPVACDVSPLAETIQSPGDADRDGRRGFSPPPSVPTISHAEEQIQKIQLQLRQLHLQKRGIRTAQETKQEETRLRKELERLQKQVQ